MYDYQKLQQTISATPPQSVAQLCAAITVAGGTVGRTETSKLFPGNRSLEVLDDFGRMVDVVCAGALPD